MRRAIDAALEKYVIAYRRNGEGEGGFGEHDFDFAVIGNLTVIGSLTVIGYGSVASRHAAEVIVGRDFCFCEEMAEVVMVVSIQLRDWPRLFGYTNTTNVQENLLRSAKDLEVYIFQIKDMRLGIGMGALSYSSIFLHIVTRNQQVWPRSIFLVF